MLACMCVCVLCVLLDLVSRAVVWTQQKCQHAQVSSPNHLTHSHTFFRETTPPPYEAKDTAARPRFTRRALLAV